VAICFLKGEKECGGGDFTKSNAPYLNHTKNSDIRRVTILTL
jgi:hypothetical protein